MKTNKIRSSKELSAGLIKSLRQALSHVKQERSNDIRTKLVVLSNSPLYKGKDIKRIRRKVCQTQGLFAKTLGVSVKTVEAWEANRNIPQGPAQRILFILDKKPEVINSL
jgi:putative transcriptional regulator